MIDSILMDLVMEYRNFILKRSSKMPRNSLDFLGILSLLSMICFSCLLLLEKLQISYYHLLLAWFFSTFFSYYFGLEWSNGWSNQFWCLREFFNHISVPFKYLDYKSFLIEIFYWSLFLLCIGYKMSAVIHGLFSSCRNSLF